MKSGDIVLKAILVLLIPMIAIGGVLVIIGSIIKALGCLFWLDRDSAMDELEVIIKAFKRFI